MPNLGPFHPQIVHFVVGLLLVGVALRWIALTGKVPFAGPAATTLLLLGTVAAVLAVSSGTDAHDVVERIPGVGQAVRDHEDWGHTTRTVFLIVAGLEIVALVLARRRAAWGRWALVLSGLVGLFGCYAVYETADRGGRLVYTFAAVRACAPETRATSPASSPPGSLSKRWSIAPGTNPPTPRP